MPRLGEYTGDEKPEELKELTPGRSAGLVRSTNDARARRCHPRGAVPEGGFLRDLKTGGVLDSPFLKGIVAIIFFGGVLVGFAYGIAAGTIRSDADVMRAMEKAMATMALYLVLVFFAAQFVAFFNWTHLGRDYGGQGGGALQASGIGRHPLISASSS